MVTIFQAGILHRKIFESIIGAGIPRLQGKPRFSARDFQNQSLAEQAHWEADSVVQLAKLWCAKRSTASRPRPGLARQREIDSP
jgi:hypothetical protein